MGKKPVIHDHGFSFDAKNVAIGLDQSYNGFGITWLDMDTGEWRTQVYKAPGSHIDRLVSIMEFLETSFKDLFRAKRIVVGMEGYAYGSHMANMLGELGGIVKLSCYTYLKGYEGQYPYIIPPTTLKKYVTGKGTGVQKNQMLLQIFKKWGVEFYDDNAADSFALARLVSGKAELEYEKEVLKKLQEPNFREKP